MAQMPNACINDCRRFVDAFRALKLPGLHVLLNNAGVHLKVSCCGGVWWGSLWSCLDCGPRPPKHVCLHTAPGTPTGAQARRLRV
jgi:hypothetical protein